jgi:N-acetylneuraminate synthase
MKNEFWIEDRHIGDGRPVYFIADIAANHDGNLQRAKDLIYMAAEAGADAAKFQHFSAKTIVSDKGFKDLGAEKSHQSNWEKSVYEVYADASVDLSWTAELRETCKKAGISFFTSPYSLDLVDQMDAFVPAYKIGSGDITWTEIIEYIASKQKPYILATGASTTDDVVRAVDAALNINQNLCLMQCNTNYTASLENFRYIQLNVLRAYSVMYPKIMLGLSDHTPGHSTVLGAIALGAKMVEKHFTDDNNRSGPDHRFSMTPSTWREMVDRSRELELALGNGVKKVEANEQDTVVVQRRSIRLKENLLAGEVLKKEQVEFLRPCPLDAIPPHKVDDVVGRKLSTDFKRGEYIRWIDLR